MGALCGTSISLSSPFFVAETDDARILVEAAFCRLNTRKGTLWTHPDYGLLLSDLVKKGLTPDEIARIPGDVEAELEKDRRLRSVDVVPQLERTRGRGGVRLRLDITLHPMTGPDVSFAVAADSLSLELLLQTGG